LTGRTLPNYHLQPKIILRALILLFLFFTAPQISHRNDDKQYRHSVVFSTHPLLAAEAAVAITLLALSLSCQWLARFFLPFFSHDFSTYLLPE
jgi:hypothetical protein